MVSPMSIKAVVAFSSTTTRGSMRIMRDCKSANVNFISIASVPFDTVAYPKPQSLRLVAAWHHPL